MKNEARDWTVKLPFPSRSKKTTAELIILILAGEWPLSAKGIFNRLGEKYLKEISMQAVHKATKKLLSEDILVREKRYYKLNHEWLGKLEKFSRKVKNDYRLHATRLNGLP